MRGSGKDGRIQAPELHRKVDNFLEERPFVQLRHEHPELARKRFLISFCSVEPIDYSAGIASRFAVFPEAQKRSRK